MDTAKTHICSLHTRLHVLCIWSVSYSTCWKTQAGDLGLDLLGAIDTELGQKGQSHSGASEITVGPLVKLGVCCTCGLLEKAQVACTCPTPGD